MKTKSKALLLTLCVVVLIAGTLLGTLAYLTDIEAAANTFTVGKVNISLDEAVVDPETGKAVTPAKRTEEGKGNIEVKMVPGREIDKDPTVTVLEKSEASYVRMKVTLSHYTELKAIFGDNFLPQYFVKGWDSALWQSTKVATEAADGKSVTYEFRYNGTPDGKRGNNELKPLFTKITVPTELDNDELASLKGLNITVTAEAIQAAGFANADAAWAAFATQHPNS